jgi:hypothetical protein
MTEGTPARQPDVQAALEFLKQIIALASGVLAISATFIEKFWTPKWQLQGLLSLSWLLLVTAILAGLQGLSSLVQVLRRPDLGSSTIAARNWARLSKWTFIVGIAGFCLFAFLAAFPFRETMKPTDPRAACSAVPPISPSGPTHEGPSCP